MRHVLRPDVLGQSRVQRQKLTVPGTKARAEQGTRFRENSSDVQQKRGGRGGGGASIVLPAAAEERAAAALLCLRLLCSLPPVFSCCLLVLKVTANVPRSARGHFECSSWLWLYVVLAAGAAAVVDNETTITIAQRPRTKERPGAPAIQ